MLSTRRAVYVGFRARGWCSSLPPSAWWSRPYSCTEAKADGAAAAAVAVVAGLQPLLKFRQLSIFTDYVHAEH
jgi:hypothetical protein